MKITTQLQGSIVGIAIIGVCSLIGTFATSTDGDAKIVNQSGIVRGASQKLIKQEMAGQTDDQLISKLDKTIDALINGDKELGLPPAKNPDFLAKMQQVKTNWSNLKTSIVKLRQDPSYADEIFNESQDFFTITNDAVFAAEAIYNSKVKNVKLFEIFLFSTEIVIIIAILFISRRISFLLKFSANNIASSSTEIASTVEQQERTVNEQASSVSQTTTTMDELGSSSRQSAEQAESSANGAKQALSLAEQGTQAVQQTMAGMNLLQDKVQAIA
jgi:methyl-accepting chemotaxis protein